MARIDDLESRIAELEAVIEVLKFNNPYFRIGMSRDEETATRNKIMSDMMLKQEQAKAKRRQERLENIGNTGN